MVSLELPPHPSSATRARRVTCEHLAGCAPEVVDTAALLVTELVAYVIRRARGALHLDVEMTPVAIHLRVRDCSPAATSGGAMLEELPGLGLALVELLASEWGIDDSTDSRSVWCAVALPDGATRDND